ncbi:MAG: Ig-like domain-containing protein [Pseudonocardia sp.]|nr:Ig-like domain-containing protein [Pseudonocardia sp.]
MAVGTIAALAVGCATASARTPQDADAPAQAQPAAPAAIVPVVTLTPAGDAAGISPVAAITASTTAGALRDVALTSAKGVAVAGALTADARRWSATEPLGYGTDYTWSGSAVAPDGSVTPLTGTFSTVAPARTVKASVNIGDGATVGVAAPIEVRFNRDLSDEAKAEVERTLSITTSTPVEGAWAWLPDNAEGSRVHYRTKEYWPTNTQVTFAAAIYGHDLGAAGYGKEDVGATFTVGRSQIVKADEDSHHIVVIRDGQEVMNLPASYGLESDPRRVTRSGIHIVMAKSEKVLMSNPDYGYVNQPEYWAVRISNNGEFIHANPASRSAQGRRNISHGCINLSTANAKAYFATALYGDPVEVTGSSVPLSAQDGDIYDWTIPWDQWTAMSKLAA